MKLQLYILFQATQPGQVAVKYRRNVGSLSIDMSAGNRTITLGRRIGRHIGRVSVDISTDARPMCRSICRPTHLGRHIDRLSTDVSVAISTDTWPICRLIHRSRVGRYVDRYIGRGVHKIHMIQDAQYFNWLVHIQNVMILIKASYPVGFFFVLIEFKPWAFTICVQ